VNIEVTQAHGIKCPRCWHFHEATLNPDGMCNRCLAIVTKFYPTTEPGKMALSELEARGLKPEDNPAWDAVDKL